MPHPGTAAVPSAGRQKRRIESEERSKGPSLDRPAERLGRPLRSLDRPTQIKFTAKVIHNGKKHAQAFGIVISDQSASATAEGIRNRHQDTAFVNSTFILFREAATRLAESPDLLTRPPHRAPSMEAVNCQIPQDEPL
jgi:hypothetical protein